MPKGDQAYEELTRTCREYNATLVAVSKTRTIPEIMELYRKGQRVFGENRVSEILTKAPNMPPDIEWHLIGHLQTNKVKIILPHVSCIQSLDSIRLWEKLNESAVVLDRRIDCLLQIKIAQEESKYGWQFVELIHFLNSGSFSKWSNVHITGVMGMATLTEDMDQVRKEMKMLKQYFEQLKEDYFKSDEKFRIVSMGMSGDYGIALEEGSNMIRIGTMLFT